MSFAYNRILLSLKGFATAQRKETGAGEGKGMRANSSLSNRRPFDGGIRDEERDEARCKRGGGEPRYAGDSIKWLNEPRGAILNSPLFSGAFLGVVSPSTTVSLFAGAVLSIFPFIRASPSRPRTVSLSIIAVQSRKNKNRFRLRRLQWILMNRFSFLKRRKEVGGCKERLS